jgi:hypothetical protein
MTIAKLFLIGAGFAAAAGAVPTYRMATGQEPEVRSPRHEQHIGIAGDELCVERRPCNKIRATGWVPPGRFPFFVSGPVKAAPTMWVQPDIHRVGTDGTFSGLVNLGEPHIGQEEWFKVYVFACTTADALSDGQQLTEPPDGCEMSDPVDVYRER